MYKETIQINVNWNSEKSIDLAEKQKTMLENDGYHLINHFGGMINSVMIYAK